VKIEDEFRVAVPVEEAWKVLLDVERIAPCMPGAQLQEIEGDEFRGIVKVKVGPITAQYKGVARIESADEATHTVVIKADGRDTRGQGNASATVTAVLEPDGTGTVVKIDTDLNITGKVAQFGRGVMADVSEHIIDQFAANLATELQSGTISTSSATAAPSGNGGDGSMPSTSTAGPGPVVDRVPSRAPAAAQDSLDVLTLLKAPARRLAPPLGVGLVIGFLLGRAGRRASQLR
jgi:carbon monoxide dehydrogenase subunit G